MLNAVTLAGWLCLEPGAVIIHSSHLSLILVILYSRICSEVSSSKKAFSVPLRPRGRVGDPASRRLGSGLACLTCSGSKARDRLAPVCWENLRSVIPPHSNVCSNDDVTWPFGTKEHFLPSESPAAKPPSSPSPLPSVPLPDLALRGSAGSEITEQGRPTRHRPPGLPGRGLVLSPPGAFASTLSVSPISPQSRSKQNHRALSGVVIPYISLIT